MQKNKIAAAIDIGSSIVRMHISQWDGHNIITLDKLEKPTQIGKEVFSTGHISFDTVRELSTVLSGFCDKAREYGITSVHTISSTAMREASNQAYILDHLMTRNKLEVRVLEDTEVSSLLLDAMKNKDYAPTEKTLFVYGGTGTTDFELIKNTEIAFAHSIQTGLLKIAEMLRDASEFSKHVEQMAEEYLDTFLTRENRLQDLWKANSIVFGAPDLAPLYEFCGIKPEDNAANIPVKAFMEKTGQQGLLTLQGELLYSMITLLSVLLRLTRAKKLFCTEINLADAMLDLILRPGAKKSHGESLRAGAISAAFDLAARYHCDIKHCEHVTRMALRIFEKLRKPFGFIKKQDLLLHIACILHESGHYANSDNVAESSFNLIKDAQIYGLCSRDALITANIIAPQSLLGVTRNVVRGGVLDGDDVLFAAKMHAILYLTDALDYSRKQKAKLSDVFIEDDCLVISVQIREDFTLEQWLFKESAVLFKEIFGIEPKLRINNVYHMEGKR